jgi:hypothetical protein
MNETMDYVIYLTACCVTWELPEPDEQPLGSANIETEVDPEIRTGG